MGAKLIRGHTYTRKAPSLCLAIMREPPIRLIKRRPAGDMCAWVGACDGSYVRMYGGVRMSV